MAKEKRVRRGFATIITDKVTKKYGEKVDETALQAFNLLGIYIDTCNCSARVSKACA